MFCSFPITPSPPASRLGCALKTAASPCLVVQPPPPSVEHCLHCLLSWMECAGNWNTPFEGQFYLFYSILFYLVTIRMNSSLNQPVCQLVNELYLNSYLIWCHFSVEFLMFVRLTEKKIDIVFCFVVFLIVCFLADIYMKTKDPRKARLGQWFMH